VIVEHDQALTAAREEAAQRRDALGRVFAAGRSEAQREHLRQGAEVPGPDPKPLDATAEKAA
jgi:hypothetical protein